MGDQPQAIDSLANGVLNGDKEQVLLGVTGSGKTFTMANIIEKVNRPTLILAHNKTLAAQLCSEFKEFFPDNAVEYFVSAPVLIISCDIKQYSLSRNIILSCSVSTKRKSPIQ